MVRSICSDNFQVKTESEQNLNQEGAMQFDTLTQTDDTELLTELQVGHQSVC